MQPESDVTDQLLEDLGAEEELADEGFEEPGEDITMGLLDATDLPSHSSLTTTTTVQKTASDTPSAVSGELVSKLIMFLL